ncbi:MAG: flavodoxin [Spirochaetaceae bacterium]|jgi:flavodoxin|nr:flavodoxin [Spirochaetaceae bacterium]
MKTVIAYYSYEGHTALVAGELAKLLDADRLRIETQDEKERTGLSKYLWGGKMVFTGKRPPLKPLALDARQYDLIVLGGPIWAGKPAPALLSFVDKAGIKDKKTAFFLCHLGGPGKAAESLSSALALSGTTVVGDIDLKNVTEGSLPALAERLSAWAERLRLVC